MITLYFFSQGSKSFMLVDIFLSCLSFIFKFTWWNFPFCWSRILQRLVEFRIDWIFLENMEYTNSSMVCTTSLSSFGCVIQNEHCESIGHCIFGFGIFPWISRLRSIEHVPYLGIRWYGISNTISLIGPKVAQKSGQLCNVAIVDYWTTSLYTNVLSWLLCYSCCQCCVKQASTIDYTSVILIIIN